MVTRSDLAGRGMFRAASLGVEFFKGSITDPAAMAEATRGCSVVFHCAYGSHGSERAQRDVTVLGTRALAAAASRNGVRLFVNLSTLVVCGPNTPEHVDKGFVERRMWAWPYAVDKRDAEEELACAVKASAMAAVNLRLGPVYGPWGPAFTISPLKTLAASRLAVVGDGAGQSNAVYVDDVVQAMVRAAIAPQEGFETYLITGPEDVTWRRFYSAYCEMLGVNRLVSLPVGEHRRQHRRKALAQVLEVVPAAVRALAKDPSFRSAARHLPFTRSVYATMTRLRRPRAAEYHSPKVIEEPLQLVTIPPMMVDYFACRTKFSHQKAVERLGYRPQYDLAAGMLLVRDWARWAGLL